MLSFRNSMKLILRLGSSEPTHYVFSSFNTLIILFFILLAIGSGYLYMFLDFKPLSSHDWNLGSFNISIAGCDVFNGIWVYDESYPLYNASECPLVDAVFNCKANGRKDNEYMKWRWKPNNCEIPRFNVHAILEKLHGKRIVFVGDSLGRNQWASMICLLMTGVKNKSSVYEVHGNKITRTIRHLNVLFSSFNISVEFYRTVFLMKISTPPKDAPNNVKATLRLDELDDSSREWIHSDVLVFNSAEWWHQYELSYRGCYFQVGDSLKQNMSINDGFKTALSTTWASWIKTMVNTNKTRIFFRTYEANHYGGLFLSCIATSRPMKTTDGRDRGEFGEIVMEVIKNQSLPVTLLNVAPMGAYRSDAHVGRWGYKPTFTDCLHWCLPGVPDTWNEILFFSLFS